MRPPGHHIQRPPCVSIILTYFLFAISHISFSPFHVFPFSPFHTFTFSPFHTYPFSPFLIYPFSTFHTISLSPFPFSPFNTIFFRHFPHFLVHHFTSYPAASMCLRHSYTFTFRHFVEASGEYFCSVLSSALIRAVNQCTDSDPVGALEL